MSQLPDLSESILPRLLNQDEEAWSELRHWLMVLFERYLGYSHTVQEREEAVQLTIEELIRHNHKTLRSYSGQGTFAGFLWRVAKRVAYRLWVKPPKIDLVDIDEFFERLSTEEMEFQKIDFWLTAENCLSSELFFVLRLTSKGASIAEIAELLTRSRGVQITENYVGVMKNRAIAQIRKCLNKGVS